MISKAWLTCPACGEEAIESTCDFRPHGFAPMEPGWTEDDGGKCPGCGVVLRVVVDDWRAYAEEAEA